MSAQIFNDLIAGCYSGSDITYDLSDDDEVILFSEARIVDPQFEHSQASDSTLNDLAIAHRLATTIGRHNLSLPEGARFAIKAVEVAVSTVKYRAGHHIKMKFSISGQRKGTITAIETDIVSMHEHQQVHILIVFDVISPSLAVFLRHARGIGPAESLTPGRLSEEIHPVNESNLTYYPGKRDNLSDGQPVDHIPALRVIDIAMQLAKRVGTRARPGLMKAHFANFIDPRRTIDITWNAEGEFSFLQDSKQMATVRV